MAAKMSRIRLGIVAVVALTLTVSMTSVGVILFPVGDRMSSPGMWMDKYRAEDVWRVLVNGFASANPDYGVSFLDSRRDELPVSSQGGELRLVLSPMPGILGNDLRFESSIKLLADGSVETPRLWSSRISAAYRLLAFRTAPVEDMLDEVRGPFWATGVVWFKRPMTMAEVAAFWPHAIQTVFFPPSARGAEAPPITWSATTTCTIGGMKKCEDSLSAVAQFQRWASSLTAQDYGLLEQTGMDGEEIKARAASGRIAGMLVTSDLTGMRQLARSPAVEGAQVVEVTRMWG